MSLKTWKEEFYTPVRSLALAGMSATKADIKRVKHSITKWKGLTPENLEKHGVTKGYAVIQSESSVLGIDGETCALCHSHLNPGAPNSCYTCPLYTFLGHKCDRAPSGGPKGSVYAQWLDNEDAQPMIAALEGTLAQLEAKLE